MANPKSIDARLRAATQKAEAKLKSTFDGLPGRFEQAQSYVTRAVERLPDVLEGVPARIDAALDGTPADAAPTHPGGPLSPVAQLADAITALSERDRRLLKEELRRRGWTIR